MEQHGDELDNDDGEEKEHEDDSNGFKVQILFGDDDLGNIDYRTGLWSLYLNILHISFLHFPAFLKVFKQSPK